METKINKQVRAGWERLKMLYNGKYIELARIKELNQRGIEVYY